MTLNVVGNEKQPVFGIIASGGVGGATIREIRLANELVRRGYRVHFWWAFYQPKSCDLARSVTQHLLFRGLRYRFGRFRGATEALQGVLERIAPSDHANHPPPARLIEITLRNYLRLLCDGIDLDKVVVERFLRDVKNTGVTHWLPSVAIFAPFVFAAREKMRPSPKCLIQFQGEELAVNYAVRAGFGDEVNRVFRDFALRSDWLPIVCSEDYAKRIGGDIGLDPSAFKAITPGVPRAMPIERDAARSLVGEAYTELQTDQPLISYVGRQDTEKGVDLFLYALKILRTQGVSFQALVCGPSGFGTSYRKTLKEIALHTRMSVIWQDHSPNKELLNAILAASRCIVYPSIHHEPFGMVPAEAAAYGTPSVVPDRGGLPEAIRAEGMECGLLFRPWDSGDLAKQIGRLIADEDLWHRLSAAASEVADHHSVERMTDRLLSHIGVEEGKKDSQSAHII